MGGRTTRSKISNLKPTSREDHKAQEPVQVNISKAAGVQSRSRGADRFSYLFVLGHSPWADVYDPFDHLDEQAHFCECSACQNLSYLLSPGSIETFLQRQLSRTESLIQDPSSRPGPVLMTDASDYGWSGVILPYVIRDIWWGLDQYRSINEREMLAVTLFVQFMRYTLAGKHVVIHTDR